MGCVESANERDAKREREGMAMQQVNGHQPNARRAGSRENQARQHKSGGQKKPGSSRQTRVLSKGVEIATQTEQTAGLLLLRVSSRIKRRHKGSSSLAPPDPALLFDLNRSAALSHSRVSQYIEQALGMPGEQQNGSNADHSLRSVAPLSDGDMKIIQGCWKQVQKDMTEFGVDLFVRLLEANPAVKRLFPFGKLDLSADELRRNADLRSHGLRVMETVGTAVHGLGEWDLVVPILEDLAARHGVYGASPEHFHGFEEAFIYSLGNGLPPKVFNAEARESWLNLLKAIAAVMSNTMRDGRGVYEKQDDGPISERDKQLVQASWRAAERDLVGLGAALFVRLLEKNPEIRNLFPFGKLHVSPHKLKDNRDLRAHGKNVMETIGSAVETLDHPGRLVPFLEALGARHKMYGAKPEHFKPLAEALIFTLKNGLPPKVFTAEAQEAWENALKVVAELMGETMRSDDSDVKPLSQQDKHLVRGCWKIIQKDMANLGVELFVRLLDKNPAIQGLFTFGKLSLPAEKLKQNKDLRSHGQRVMSTIGAVVLGLDDPDIVATILEELGTRHKAYGAKPEHFPALEEALMYTLKNGLPPKLFTPEAQEAWHNLMQLLATTMNKTMRGDSGGDEGLISSDDLRPVQSSGTFQEGNTTDPGAGLSGRSHDNGTSDVAVSADDKRLLRESWKFIQKDMVNLGTVMFVRLLERNPTIRPTFIFGRVPPDQLGQNADLRAHARGVMLTIGALVSQADDLRKIVPMMEDLGARHKTYGAKIEHFPAIADAFMYSMTEGLSPKVFTPKVREAWKRILNVVAVTMGSTMSGDEEQTTSPISPSDKQLVHDSWKFVQKDLVNTGAIMFARLLEKNPTVRNLFPFGNVSSSPKKLEQNPKLRAHGRGVMETIGAVVDDLDDLDKAVPILEGLGTRHKSYGARPEHFAAVIEAFVFSLKQSLPPGVFTSETETAWRNVLKVVDVTMSRTMRLDENGNSEGGLIALGDKLLVQKSWKVMQKDSVNLGAALFARFLDQNPSIRELFPFGKSLVPPQMLRHNSDLQAHASGVMETIGAVVDGLDDLGKIVPLLKDLGARHKRHGAKPEHFQPLLDAFMYTMRNGLSPEEFTPDVQAAWDNIWKVLAEVMGDDME